MYGTWPSGSKRTTSEVAGTKHHPDASIEGPEAPLFGYVDPQGGKKTDSRLPLEQKAGPSKIQMIAVRSWLSGLALATVHAFGKARPAPP